MTRGNERGSGVKIFHKKTYAVCRSIQQKRWRFVVFFASFIYISSLEKAATDLI